MCSLKIIIERKPGITSFLIIVFILTFAMNGIPQLSDITWAGQGHSYYLLKKNEIIQYNLPENLPKKIFTKKNIAHLGNSHPGQIDGYAFTGDQKKVLLYANTESLWHMRLKGDFWVLDMETRSLNQLGKTFPESSLMFAKFSPDGKSVAYVCQNNIYIEDLATSQIRALTTSGTSTLFNGTFDIVYQQEFSCHDGFRWSPDGKSIAYWQINADSVKKFNLINNTDSIYSQVIPIEYAKAGQNPSSCKVGVVNIEDANTTWMNLPGDPFQHYIIRMEYIPNSGNLLIQQLNRKQNQSKLFIVDISTGNTHLLQEESDEAWVEIFQTGDRYNFDFINTFTWLNETNSILWISEKDGWRHLYMIPLDGSTEKLITKGNYDLMGLKYVDYENGYIYFIASPENATQRYLYRTALNGDGEPELMSPFELKGTHNYSFSADGKYASHTFSNSYTKEATELITIPDHKSLREKESIVARLDSLQQEPAMEFFRINTIDSVEMDGWMVKPKNFDSAKKYPVVFYVYTEPYYSTVRDRYGIVYSIYKGNMAEDGYIYISLDNRGTPAPKGRAWRKAIYRKIGQVNIRDQAMAAKEILKWEFVDPERIAVWGWSGGGTAALNLLFQYPEIYKTGIAIAAVCNQLTYDNVYSERYMGLPQENMTDYVNGSPITYAKNLAGNLLYIHGTADDNVHYQNAEMLVNELIKHNKQFQFMPYPNRNHGIWDGEETWLHLQTLLTSFLRKNCPPGGK